MITRAMIAKNIPNGDGTWSVFIPIFTTLPRDSKTRDLLVYNNGSKIANVQKNNYNPNKDSVVDFDIDKNKVLNKLSSVTTDKLSGYTYDAVVCGVMGVNYNFSMGDVVLVTFENNDMTRPIIIGSLITKDILEKRSSNPETKYAGLTVDSITVNSSADLPDSTDITFSINGDAYSLNKESFAKIWGKSYETFLDSHPIHSLYITIDPTDPSETFGGYWEQITDVFILAASNINSESPTYVPSSNSQDGGESSHALTLDEMPAHSHYSKYATINGSYSDPTTMGRPSTDIIWSTASNIADGGAITTTTGGGNSGWNFANSSDGYPHNNMPPYKIFYMWYRITEEEFNAHLQ